MRKIDMEEEYEYWKEKYIKISKKYYAGEPIQYDLLRKHNLKDARWYIKNCNNDNVDSYVNWIRYELKLIPNRKMTKSECIKIINIMSENLNRPLYYNDFAKSSNTQTTLNIGALKNYWKSMNDMKLELGLEIVKEDMISKNRSKEQMLLDLKKLINELGHLPISCEIDNCQYTLNCSSYVNYFGGVNNAFIELGYKPNKKSISLHITNDEIFNIYRNFINKSGIAPSFEYATLIYELPSPSTVLRRFNCTWNEFITMLGCEPNSCIYNITKAIDGTECKSVGEAIVYNYLLNLPINNLKRETCYKNILDDNLLKKEAGNKRLDWNFEYNNKHYYIELFGLMGKESYEKTHDKKIDLITRDGKINNFIAIYPKDLNKLDEIFKFIK